MFFSRSATVSKMPRKEVFVWWTVRGTLGALDSDCGTRRRVFSDEHIVGFRV